MHLSVLFFVSRRSVGGETNVLIEHRGGVSSRSASWKIFVVSAGIEMFRVCSRTDTDFAVVWAL